MHLVFAALRSGQDDVFMRIVVGGRVSGRR